MQTYDEFLKEWDEKILKRVKDFDFIKFGKYRDDVDEIDVDELIKFFREFAEAQRQWFLNQLPDRIELPLQSCINSENRMFGRCFECEKNKGYNQALSDCRIILEGKS